MTQIESAVDAVYFFEELFKGTQASYLEPVNMDSLGRSAIEAFVARSKCRVKWGSSEVEVKCFHHSIKAKLPLKSAEKNARLCVRLLQLPQVSELNANQMRENMAEAIVNSLDDPFSTYFSSDQVKRLKNYGQWTPGLDADPKVPSRVHSIRPNAAADKAGIFVGDQLIRLNGRSVKGLSFAQIGTLLVGPAEELLVVDVKRGDEILSFRLPRQNTEEVPLWAQKVEKDFLYIRPGRFDDGLADTMWVQLAPHSQVEGIILDLRHNPGGLVTEGVSFLNGFLKEGLLGTVHPRKGHPQKVYRANRSQIMPHVPMVILVDGGTASVSEFVATVLKKRRNAILVGQATLGKGKVQRLIPLPDGGSLKISVAQLSGPSGQRIAKSIEVDEFLAPAIGGTAISGLNPVDDSWVQHAAKLLRSRK